MVLGGVAIYNKYKDIRGIYNIISIEDDYILVQRKNKTEKVYIYEVKPLLFLDLEEDMQNNIVSIYTEFLRRIESNIQFYITNRKLNIDQYIKDQFFKKEFNNTRLDDIYNQYVSDIKDKLKSENIFTTKIYIVFSQNSKENNDIKELEDHILLLERLGCKISKITRKSNLKQILFETLNKI